MNGRATFIVGKEPAGKIDPDDPGRPLEMSLTPRERDVAAFGAVHLERLRRERNRRDEASSLSIQLAAASEEP